MIFSSSVRHLLMVALPFLCCSSFVHCSTFCAISISSWSWISSRMYSPEKMVLAHSTQPQGSRGSSLKMLGYLDLSLGAEAVLLVGGAGGGTAGMGRPLRPGMGAVKAAGTVEKSQGMLLMEGAFSLGSEVRLGFFSFLIFLLFSFFFLCFERDLDSSLESDGVSEGVSESESEEQSRFLSFFFFFFSSFSFFSFFLRSFDFSRSLSLCFFLSPIINYKSHHQIYLPLLSPSQFLLSTNPIPIIVQAKSKTIVKNADLSNMPTKSNRWLVIEQFGQINSMVSHMTRCIAKSGGLGSCEKIIDASGS